MKRTISENLRDRFSAQADEAEAQGLISVAEHLTCQIEKNAVRPSDSIYTYAENELKDDVEGRLWDAAIRVADFHGQSIDATDIQEVVNRAAKEFVHELRLKIGATNGAGAYEVGAYEPTLPGEKKEHVILELKEEDE